MAPIGNAVARACALRVAHGGATVLALDPDGDAVGTTVAAIEAAAGTVTGHVVDTENIEELRAVQRIHHDGGGGVDILVTCHFSLDWTSIEVSTMDDWERVIRHNVLGPIACVKAFLPALRASPSGTIVHLGSIDGLLGNPAVPSYSVSKGALVPLTHVMAEEFAGHGIRVNCVARAAVDDPAVDVPPGGLARALDHTPLRRAATPDEVAAVVSFLASDDASYVTGAIVPVDGGRSGLTPGTV